MRKLRESTARVVTLAALVAPATLASLGCAQPDAVPEPTESTSIAETASPSLEQERIDKLRAAPVVQRIAEIDVPAARSHRRVPAPHAPSALFTKLDAAPIPALVPDDPPLLAIAKVTAGRDWYAVSMSAPDVNVFVTGTRLETVIPSLGDGAKGGMAPRRVTRARGIARLTFLRFGAAYTLEVECAAPQTDPRCTGDDYILSLSDSLAVAGGVQ